MHQPGILTINLDPNCISFLSDSGVLTTATCSDAKLISLLVDLGFEMSDHWPPAECIVRMRGTFSLQALASVGLKTAAEMETNAA